MRLLTRRSTPATAVIADPERHTVMSPDGAVRSVQAANLYLPEDELNRIWSAMHLERLARTYWRFLSRIFLGLIRVHYTATERTVVFITPPFRLLRFYPPVYDITATRGIVRWRIRDGFLVAHPGRDKDGYLEIDVRRFPADEQGRARVHVEVEVANFFPMLAFSIARWFYANTQSRIHVLATHGFLRHLARLDFAESRVGRFARYGVGTPPPAFLLADLAGGDGHEPAPPPEDVTEGSTPWLVVAVIAALNATAAYLLLRRWSTRRPGIPPARAASRGRGGR